jgi:hypothetical protein
MADGSECWRPLSGGAKPVGAKLRAVRCCDIIGHQDRLIRVGAEQEGHQCQARREHDQEHQGHGSLKQRPEDWCDVLHGERAGSGVAGPLTQEQTEGAIRRRLHPLGLASGANNRRTFMLFTTRLLHQLCNGHGMGCKQVGESLRERGKAKLKSAGESHLWHRAMAVEKEVCTLSPHQLHHPPGHGKEPGAMKGVRERFGELATGNRIGTGADEWACNGFLIQGV